MKESYFVGSTAKEQAAQYLDEGVRMLQSATPDLKPEDLRAILSSVDRVHTRSIAFSLYAIVERLDRIAGVLELSREDISRCAHGVTGICMACVMQNDLLRPLK